MQSTGGPLEDPDTCERLSGFYRILGATWASLRAEALVKALAVFIVFWAQHGPLGAETLVNA